MPRTYSNRDRTLQLARRRKGVTPRELGSAGIHRQVLTRLVSEGRIEREGKVMPFQTGVSLLAIRGGAPIFPVYLDGLQRNVPMLETYLSAQYPSVAWGKPIFTQGRSTARNGLEALTRELQASVESLGARYPSPRRRGKSMLE